MPQVLSDTHPEVEALQIRMLREITTAKRFSLANGLTRSMIRLAKRAIERANLTMSSKERGLIYVDIHYGSETADQLRMDNTLNMSNGEVELLDAIRPVIDAFNRLGILYYLGGSVASSIYGIARSTLDADLVAVFEDHMTLDFVALLKDQYYVNESMIRDAIARKSSFNLIFLETMFKVDVFIAKNRAFDQSALTRIRHDQLAALNQNPSFDVCVASPEDVVLNKLEWYRLGNEISERQWSDVLGVLKVQQFDLDYPYLEHWAKQLNVNDLLCRALKDSGIKPLGIL